MKAKNNRAIWLDRGRQMDMNILYRFDHAFSWLIPRRCLTCKSTIKPGSHPLCPICYRSLPFQTNSCRRCGQAFNADQDYCGRCLHAPPPFDACFCPFRYAEPINQQIQRFKYAARPELAKALAVTLYTEIRGIGLEMPDLLIPVPLHIHRLRSRGYNQSWLLVRELARLLDIPCSNRFIKKDRATAAQTLQSLRQRKSNVRGSFSLRRPIPARSVAIVDDVITTGSTVAEIAKILKRNGVDYVQAWGVAHTI
ncbi:MAG: hypothetical protein HKN85_11945 [Gammaproteobacteria bacterium]|nr:hypothetical protein [Gammaproteobacteria bacterium]